MDFNAPFQPSTHLPSSRRITHEIIVVHGFKVYSDDQKRLVKCRRIIEDWVTLAAEPIRDTVNVHFLAVDGPHILQVGRHELSQATLELSMKLSAIEAEPSSPLSPSKVNSDDGDNHDAARSSRGAVFIAHGIGVWVVKEFLTLFPNREHRIDPTGLVFLDSPELLLNMTPVDILPYPNMVDYFSQLASLYKADKTPLKMFELQSKLRDIDTSFRKLVDARYGACEEIKGTEDDDCTFTMKAWCSNVWLSPNSVLTFESPDDKKFLRRVKKTLFSTKSSRIEADVKALDRLKLRECLEEAISMRKYRDLGDDANIVAEELSSTGLNSQAGGGKGKERAAIPMDAPKMAVNPIMPNRMKPLPLIPEEEEGQPTSGSSSNNHRDRNHKRFDEKIYDFKDALVQRDEAAAAGDHAALMTSQHRLQLVLWHQEQRLGRDHPDVFLTKCEIATTSLITGIWNGRPINRRTGEDLLAIESDTRQAYEGLEKSLGPLSRDTAAALVILLSVRVTLVEKQTLPWTSMITVLDLLKERLSDPTTRTPDRLLHTLRLRYKVATTIAQVWSYGDTLLDDLRRESDALAATVDAGNRSGLNQLRTEIAAKAEEIKTWRDQEEHALEEQGTGSENFF